MIEFIPAVRLAFQRYFEFHGRSSRAEYWWFALFILIGYFSTGLLDLLVTRTYNPHMQFGALGLIFRIVIVVPGFALGSRRLHDINRSGWWQLLWIAVITVIPVILLVYWHIKQGDTSFNNYGAQPQYPNTR